jgi:hypothetical protein
VAGLVGAAALLVWAGYLAAPTEVREVAPLRGRVRPHLFAFVTGGLTLAALGFLVRQSDVAARLEGGEHVLRYPAVWRWLVPLTAPIPLLLLGFSLGMPRNREVFAIGMLGLTVLWIFGALEVFQSEVRLGPDFVSGRTLLGARVRVPWPAIRIVEWNAAMQWFVIGSDQDRIRVGLFVSGLEALADEVARRVPSLAAAPALDVMRRRRALFDADE